MTTRMLAATVLSTALLGACGGEPPAVIAQTGAALPTADAARDARHTNPGAPAPVARAILHADDLDAAEALLDGRDAPPASAQDAEPLPPELAQVLAMGPGGMPLELLDALDLGMDGGGSDALPLVLGSSSVVDATLDQTELPDPAAAADAEFGPLP